MATRGFMGWVSGGREVIAYNHWSSEPEGLGLDILAWLVNTDHAAARQRITEVRVVDPESTPTAADIERLREHTDTSIGDEVETDWYGLLRGTQGRPAATLAAGVVADASDFPFDVVSCEWGYIADFDAGVFEVYMGFQYEPHDKGRFASRPRPEDAEAYPAALFTSFPLSDLPTPDAFVLACYPEEE
ncbi:hypothetical protein [Nocardiopsis sp. NPDC057823]|uniref:hypothetical protein n=1 Tax=Nocardiopsis sp. NPDC057823 TaxID=3346256 RepID=UPI003672A47C